MPSLEEQCGIAVTLGVLDDKINSNRRATELAERLGDATFAECADGQVELAKVATVVMGSSPPGSSYNEVGDGLPFYQGVRDFGRRFPGRRVWTTAPARLAKDNDTLLSVRAPVGNLNRASEQCCVGRGLAAVGSRTPSTIFYALRAASDVWKPFQQEGTVFGAINKTDLGHALVPRPTDSAMHDLEQRLSALDDGVRALSQETNRLIGLRDTLLPELLSGRVRVPEADRAIQEVVA